MNMLVRYGSIFESIAVVEQQFRWAFGEFDPKNAFWIDHDKRRVDAAEERRTEVRTVLEQTEVLIVTLGLSEVWFDRTTNEPLWRTLPLDQYDPSRHEFRVLTVQETEAYLQSIARIRQEHLPDLKILYTVSPIPLIATFRPVSALTANAVSKAIIRAGLDEFLRNRQAELNTTFFYFPSYELVTDVLHRPFRADNRHLYDAVVSQVLNMFAFGYTSLSASESPKLNYADVSELLTAEVRELERSNRELQTITEEKEAMIRELSRAADERLALIEQLQANCLEKDQQILQGRSRLANPRKFRRLLG
jgi:hypothetical protein